VRQEQAVELCAAHPAIRRKAAAVLAWYQGIDPGYDVRAYDPVVAGGAAGDRGEAALRPGRSPARAGTAGIAHQTLTIPQ